jgi:hypothetical protein
MSIRLRDKHFERRNRLHHHRLGFEFLEPSTGNQALSLALFALEILLLLEVSVDFVANILLPKDFESLSKLFGKGEPALSISGLARLALALRFGESMVRNVPLRKGRFQRRDGVLQGFNAQGRRLNPTEGGSDLFVVCDTPRSVRDEVDMSFYSPALCKKTSASGLKQSPSVSTF